MLDAFFRVRLSVRPKGGGEAELVPPNILQDLHYRFVIVKEGGEEGIVRIEEPEAVLETIEQYKDCHKLTEEQMEALQKEYPTPKLKKNIAWDSRNTKREREGRWIGRLQLMLKAIGFLIPGRQSVLGFI
jgi:hypothetical protein